MDERIAIVTGAGRGIGRATAIELAKAGWRMMLCARTVRELKETRAACGGGEIFRCDVSDARQVDAMIRAVVKRYRRIDAVAHCAGAVVRKRVDLVTEREWRAMFDVNLTSIYFLWRRLRPIWAKQGGGVIVNVSSFSARDPFDGLGAYGAAKAGVNLMGVVLGREGKEIGVRVHTVAPAATETAMLREVISEEQVPKGRAMEPGEVARVIVQCICGDLRCTSGEVIYVHR